MEGLYIIIGALIGLFGSIIGSSIQNEHQEEQNKKELKFSLVIQWIDNRNKLRGGPISDYDNVFKPLVSKTAVVFSENQNIVNKCSLLNHKLKDPSLSSEVLIEYDSLIRIMCEDIGISVPNSF